MDNMSFVMLLMFVRRVVMRSLRRSCSRQDPQSSICLSVYLFICLSVYLSICLSVYLCVYVSICVYLSIYVSIRLSIDRSIYLAVSLSICLYISMCLSTYLSIYLSIYIYLSLRRFIDQCVSPCICLSFDVCMYSLCIYLSNYLSMCLCILL